MEIYVAPNLSKYTTALGAYNIKSFTYELKQHTHAHIHARANARTHTQTRSRKFAPKKIRQRNKSRRLETLLQEMGFQSLFE